MKQLLQSREHDVIKDFPSELTCDIKWKPDPDEFLGIHYTWNELLKEKELNSYYFIGICWLIKNESAFQVNPKIEKLDYLKIFLECLSDPLVAKHFDNTYKIFFNKPLININTKHFEITPLLIVHFLSVVKRICQKGLKKGYVIVNENLTGKIKGKIKVQKTIRKNLSVNRADKNICQYQIHTFDCLENQLIKTALLQVDRYINSFKKDESLIKLIKYSQFTFDSISEIKVSIFDFKKVKHSSFYTEYKDALKLTEMIFRRLGFNSRQSFDQIECKTPPFYINMPELFERFVEIKLRKNHTDILAGYGQSGYSETRSGKWELRPDFLLPSLKMIIDAKYKAWYSKNTNIDFKDDFSQLTLYSRTKEVLKKINSVDLIPKLVFIYPDVAGKDEIDLNILENNEEGFDKIFKVGVHLPIIK